MDNPLCLSRKHIRAQSQKSLQARLSGVFGMIQSFGLDSSTSFVRRFIVSRSHCRTYCYYSKPLQCNVLWKGAKTVGGGVIHWDTQDIYKHGEVELNWVMWLICCLCPSCKHGRGIDLLTEICLTIRWRCGAFQSLVFGPFPGWPVMSQMKQRFVPSMYFLLTQHKLNPLLKLHGSHGNTDHVVLFCYQLLFRLYFSTSRSNSRSKDCATCANTLIWVPFVGFQSDYHYKSILIKHRVNLIQEDLLYF